MDQFRSLLPEGKTVACLEDLSSLRVKDLKHILTAFKEKISGVKADLLLRVYAIFCRISQVETVPCYTATEPCVDEAPINAFTYDFIKFQASHLPWSDTLQNTPAFSFIQLYDYLVIRTVKYKHILLKNTSYKKLKAFQFFYEGFIKKIDVAFTDSFCFVDVRMKASMRAKIYKVIIKLSSSDGSVCSAACTCPAGVGIGGFGNCNHVGGVLFGLEDFNRRGLKSLPIPQSCTSKLSAWNIPRDSSSTPAPIDQVVIKKVSFGQDTEKEVPPKINLYDPRMKCDRNLDGDCFKTLQSKLSASLPNSCFFLFHGMNPYPPQGQMQQIEEEIISINTGFEECCSSNLSQPDVVKTDDIAFNEFYDISSRQFKNMMDICARLKTITLIEIKNIEQSTRGQSSSDAWLHHRKHKITASNFYNAARNTVEPSNKLSAMFYKSFTTSSTQHGIVNESHVLNLYKHLLSTKGVNANVLEVGLILSETYPYLGASLDGLVEDNSGNRWGIEIKCPSSQFGKTLQEAIISKNFFLCKNGNEVNLKKSHKYFYQVQGQMFCANLMRTDFVVWFGDDEPLYVETIFFDELFWNSKILPGLDFFYRRAVLPEFYTRRVQNEKKLYLHGGWLSHEEK